MPTKLEVIDGPSRGAAVALEGKTVFEVGSGPSVDLRLEDPDVAPVHMKVYVANGLPSAFDTSGQGFLHNGKKTLKAALADGDTLTVGKHELKLGREASAVPAPASAGPATRFELQAVKGNDAGRTFDLRAKDMFIVGRGVATDITVWDIRVSRVHCRIDRDKDGFQITCLNASNGTYVNGKKVETHRLAAGDEIKVGSTVFQYVQS